MNEFSGRTHESRMQELLNRIPGIEQMPQYHLFGASETHTQSNSLPTPSSADEVTTPQTMKSVLVSALKLMGQLASLIEEASSKS